MAWFFAPKSCTWAVLLRGRGVNSVVFHNWHTVEFSFRLGEHSSPLAVRYSTWMFILVFSPSGLIGSLVFGIMVFALFGPKIKRRTIANGLSQPSDNWRRSSAANSVIGCIFWCGMERCRGWEDEIQVLAQVGSRKVLITGYMSFDIQLGWGITCIFWLWSLPRLH